MFKRLIAGVLALTLACAPALAANKTPLASYPGSPNQPIKAGDVLQAPAPTTANASINLPHGTAPTSPANGDCWTTTAGLYCRVNGSTVGPYGSGGATAANPTATASDAAVNGSATTFMRSDAAPAVQKCSSSAFGVCEVDGTTITASGGVISAPGSFAPASANVVTQESTSSTSFTDLATVGPAVTMTTGTSVIVFLSAFSNKPSGSGNTAFMSVAVSGATTLAANSNNGPRGSSPNTGFNFQLGGAVLLTGLTAGSNTFTTKYQVDGSTFNFANRNITVIRVN